MRTAREFARRLAGVLLGALLIVLVTAGAFACFSYLPHQQFRRVPASGPVVLDVPFQENDIVRPNDPRARRLAGYSLFRYASSDTGGPSYSLGVVEFDDQGFLWDERQMTTLREYVLAEGRGRGVILITFMHGWNHNAEIGDNNIWCFQEVLEAVARLEYAVNGRRSRAVVGVYLGWRARLFRATWFNRATSFWDRMATADRIGDRGELLNVVAQLSSLRRELQGARRNIVVLTAHSMGARAMFSAVGGHLKASLSRAAVEKSEVEGSGDMVVLVNPAFSAADYRLVDRLSRVAHTDGAAGREPLLVLISSTGDQVLRRLYPLGEWAANWTHSIRPGIDRKILRTTAAAYPPYVTHRLLVAEGEVPPLPGSSEGRNCRCRSLVAADLPSVRNLSSGGRHEDLLEYRDLRVVERNSTGAARLLYRLKLEPRRSPETRLMVIETERAVMPDHGEMYTPALVEFLVRLVNSKISATDARERVDPSRSQVLGLRQ